MGTKNRTIKEIKEVLELRPGLTAEQVAKLTEIRLSVVKAIMKELTDEREK